MKKFYEIAKPHLMAMGIFLLVMAVYFHPQFDGKVVEQGDIIQGMGMAQESNDYYKRTGKHTLWTNAMFGGMPTYQISAPQNSNLIRKYIEPVMQLFIKAPISWFFVAALCFYVLMMVMGVHHWLAIAGSLAFSLTTNGLLLYAAGHTSKFRAISYLPLVIAGVYLLLQKRKWLAGAVCFLLGMALNIAANHYQMTYYFAIGMVFFMIVYLGFAIKSGEILNYTKAVGIMLACGVLAIGPSFSKIYTTMEYSKDTMRGTSKLKEEAAARNPDASGKEGLEWEYAMRWSNAPRDLFGTFIPGAVGGSSQEVIQEDWEMTKYFGKPTKSNPARVPLYWGGGDSTDGPTYFGAIIFFLLVLGLIVLPNNGFKYGVVGAIAVIAMLSLGKYFETFNRIFFENFPKYSNFRAHNSAMGIVSVFFPILAILGLSHFITGNQSADQKWKALKITALVSIGITAVYGFLGGGFFEFAHSYDGQYESQFKNPADYQRFLDDLRADRVSMLKSTTIRTIFLMMLAGGVLWLFVKKKLKPAHAILAVGILAVADILMVDKKYLNEDNFVTQKRIERTHDPRPVDQQILQNEPMGRGYYRVLDLSINTFSSSMASFHHNTLGGYSAVKLQRIQDLIDSSFSREVNFNVLNMFNTKYIIDRDGKAQMNQDALGNAWFVDTLKMVQNAREELASTPLASTRTTAVVNAEFEKYLAGFTPPASDSSSKATIALTSYEPNKLVYKCSSDVERFVVFSEVWYGPNKGWISKVNNQDAEHIRVNYLLRGMRVPAGESEITFEFKPHTYEVGERVSLASSVLILILLFAWLYTSLKPIFMATTEIKGAK